jgi:hypothetical protein
MIENSRNKIFVRIEKGKSGDLFLARRRMEPSPSRRNWSTLERDAFTVTSGTPYDIIRKQLLNLMPKNERSKYE